MRVYELAKKLGKESRILIAELGKLGIAVSSHSNALSEEDVRKAMKAFSGKAATQTTTRKKATCSLKPGKTAKKPSASPVKARGHAAREKEKPAEEEVRKPEKKHILIKRRKEEVPPPSDPETLATEVSPGDGLSPAALQSEPPEPVGVADEPPEVAAMTQALAAESAIPDALPSIEEKSSPVAAVEPVTTPEKTADENKKAKDEEKPKKSRKAGKPRDADLFAEIYEDAARWQDLRPLPALRRDERSRHVPSATPTEITKPRRKTVKLSSGITVKEFAEHLGIRAADVIRRLMEMGVGLTLNQPMDLDAGVLIAEGLGIQVEIQTEKEGDALLEELLEPTTESQVAPRAPVVTIMGHVDHGKTSLLDAMRQTKVTQQEAGGITQHIGAYSVQVGEKSVTFLDTPGHEAFTAMRARGAQATDIVVLVVAADDGVMPQTLEAANHAQAAEVPIVVAVNKIDKPGANPDRIKQSLSEQGLVPESWGGQTIYVEVSAKEKQGLDTLLEMLLLQAEVMELRTDVIQPAKGVVLEAKLDRGRGPVATVLVQSGTLHVGAAYVVGATSGRVRALVSHDGKKVREAGPSTPVEVIGLLGLPAAGDQLVVVKDERVAREIAESRHQKRRTAELGTAPSRLTLDALFAQGQEVDRKELAVLVKADAQGSVGALCESIAKISTDSVKVQIIHRGVGGITESDVLLASASKALVVGFHIRPDPKATALAEREGVEVRLHTIIYNAIADVKAAAEGLLEPTFTERVLGRAEVRQVFAIPKVGSIAGCYVTNGHIARASEGVRLLRDSVIVYEGRLGSLRRFKDDVREVQQGYECGIGIENFNDIKAGDVIEAYVFDKETAKL
ncbi:MAG: translation initiation factor IF-2 [Nitrospira sp.]|nr:translation initiation factor IF-2 [Nitrospira sp.]